MAAGRLATCASLSTRGRPTEAHYVLLIAGSVFGFVFVYVALVGNVCKQPRSAYEYLQMVGDPELGSSCHYGAPNIII